MAGRRHGRFRRLDAFLVLIRPATAGGAGRSAAVAVALAVIVETMAGACGGAGHPLAVPIPARGSPGTAPPAGATGPAGSTGPDGPTRSTSPSSPAQPSIDRQIAAMPLEREAGQVLMSYAYGRTATDDRPDIVHANQLLSGVDTAAQLVSRWHVGGLLLLDHNPLDVRQPALSTENLASSSTAAGYISGMQAAAKAAGDPPLVVGVDQEGGTVQRLGPPLTAFPAQMTVGAASDATSLAREEGAAIGQELRAVGVTLDFAPVADVNSEPLNPVIGTRSFGDQPDAVAALTAAEVQGLAAGGVGATAKHFPGHGSTSIDSHYGLPTIAADRATLERRDLAPFRAAIAAAVPVVMLGHLLVPSLDSATPASLSGPVVSVLRNELHFDGVVATDGLFMAALQQRYSDDDIAVRALQAGADLLVQPASISTAIPAVVGAVRSGRLPKSRLDEAVRHLLVLKQFAPHAPAGRWNLQQHAQLALRIARAGVTVVGDPGRLLPLHSARVTGTSALATRLQVALAADGVADSAATTISVDDPAARARVQVAVGTPYVLGRAPADRTLVASYDSTPSSVQALADVLSGRARAVGRLPVALGPR